MQIITAKPLIEKFRSGTFHDGEVGPYFLAYVVLEAVAWVFAYGDATPWDVAGSVASVVITVLGVPHLKKRNRDSFGDGFLDRYFALGWVVGVRMLLISIPIVVVLFALASIVGGNDAFAPAGAIIGIGFGVVFYGWLGRLIEESQPVASGQGDDSNQLPV